MKEDDSGIERYSEYCCLGHELECRIQSTLLVGMVMQDKQVELKKLKAHTKMFKKIFKNRISAREQRWKGDEVSQGHACCNRAWRSQDLFNIKTVFPRYVDSHVKDKTVSWPSYLFTTHLLSIERADWSKQLDVFKACDAKIWREFPVGFPV